MNRNASLSGSIHADFKKLLDQRHQDERKYSEVSMMAHLELQLLEQSTYQTRNLAFYELDSDCVNETALQTFYLSNLLRSNLITLAFEFLTLYGLNIDHEEDSDANDLGGPIQQAQLLKTQALVIVLFNLECLLNIRKNSHKIPGRSVTLKEIQSCIEQAKDLMQIAQKIFKQADHTLG